MRKVGILILIIVPVLIGCSSGDTAPAEPPKGMAPETVNAPPGAKNPEERGREEEKALLNGTNSPAQDGGGQDGK